jgi:hypothetical protein
MSTARCRSSDYGIIREGAKKSLNFDSLMIFGRLMAPASLYSNSSAWQGLSAPISTLPVPISIGIRSDQLTADPLRQSYKASGERWMKRPLPSSSLRLLMMVGLPGSRL